MSKIELNLINFNSLNRDPNGTKLQRIWFNYFNGLGVDLGKTKKSIIYKYKSPIIGKIRIITLETFSYSQKININDIEITQKMIKELKIENDVRRNKELEINSQFYIDITLDSFEFLHQKVVDELNKRMKDSKESLKNIGDIFLF